MYFTKIYKRYTRMHPYVTCVLVCISMLFCMYLYVRLACIRIICTLMHPCVTRMLPVVLAWCFTHGRPRALDTC